MSAIPNLLVLDILLVEDNPGDVKLVEHQFARILDLRVNLRKATNLTDAERILKEGPLHLILLDLGLPDSTGISSVKRMVKAANNRPIVVLTGLANDHIIAQALEFGAQDYVAKNMLTPELLRKTILYTVKYRDLLNRLIKDQEDLQRANNIKDEFLSIISHELRTPLTSILGYLHILQKQLTKSMNNEQKDFIATILRNADRLMSHINTLLDFSKFSHHDQKPQYQLLQSRAEIVHALKTLLIDVDPVHGPVVIDPESPSDDLLTFADPTMLSQVLTNLITNSLKYSPSTEPTLVGYKASSNNGSDGVLFWVKDRGIGVPDDLKLKIFDKFYQAEKHSTRTTGGLGLGLSIVKSIMDLHGGSAWVENNNGKGSTFYAFFPNRKDLITPTSELTTV